MRMTTITLCRLDESHYLYYAFVGKKNAGSGIIGTFEYNHEERTFKAGDALVFQNVVTVVGVEL